MGTTCKWPNYEQWSLWASARRKRIGKIVPSAVTYLPGASPSDPTPGEIRRAAVVKKKKAKVARAKALAKEKQRRLKPTKSEYLQRLRNNNYGRGK
jgi:hypothetical protein